MRILGRFGVTASLVIVNVLTATATLAQTTVSFPSASPVDLGTNLPKLADLEPWSYTLGTEWDENFSVGGIIGAPNTTVIPEVKILGETIIPQVKADTRTGAWMGGRVWGDVGLEFSADFIASGLEPGMGFNFTPTLTYDTPEAGSFIKFSTTTGVVNNPSFTESALELPAVDAKVDFFFNLDLTSSVDYGLFPFISYNSAPFNPGGIHLDQRNDADKSLVRFQASLDPDDNNGSPLPPTLTFLEGVEVLGVPLETQVGLLDDGQFLGNKQISFQIKDKQNPTGPKLRLDVGEVQVLNPFGTGGDLLGGSNDRNLKVATSVARDTIGYTAETPLFRLGLDLDGLAAGLASGQSFTRLEEDIEIKETKVAEIVADFIDLKYGPEIGFRETVEINPDFEVTLNFRDPNDGTPVEVALDDDGSVTLMSSIKSRWGDLPEIALLTSEAVEVSVSFDALTGQQSKRGAIYLSDYLEFTLLELESLNVLDIAELSLPPVFRTRTSLLGNLLGELELEAYTDNAAITPFSLGGALPTKPFTIKPAPMMLAYLTGGGDFNPDFSQVRRLSDHSPAANSALERLTVVIGEGSETSTHVGDFKPLVVTDAGHVIETDELLFQQKLLGEGDPVIIEEYSDPRQKTPVMGLQLVAGTTYRQTGSRTWETASVLNDGVYTSGGEMTRFSNPGGTMIISGSGQIEFEQRGRIDANVVVHSAGHTLRFDNATGFGLQVGPLTTIQVDPPGSSPPLPLSIRLPDVVVDGPRLVDVANVFINAGTIYLSSAQGEIYAGMNFDNTASGRVELTGDDDAMATAMVEVTTPDFTNNGYVTVGAGAQLDFRHPDANLAQQFRGDGLLRVDASTVRFRNNVSVFAPDGAEIPNAASQTFEVVNGGSLEFHGNAIFYAKPTFAVGVDSELTFNGLGLDGTDGFNSKFGDGPPIEVVNDGRIVFNSGSNNFKLAINEFLGVGEQPTIVPIGLDNHGTITIRNTARLTLDAEIRDYAEGGATFDAGTWEIIGPTPTELYSNVGFDDSNVARLNLNVSKVEVGDNFLSVINPGQPGGDVGGFSDSYNATEYDTFLSVNKSDITLSGRAKFEYLNSVRTNAGELSFRNKNHFTTEGDLRNTGTINVTGGSRLTVDGNLLVDGGQVNVDVDSVLDVGANTIEVIGGTVLVNRDAGTAFVNTPWIVREQVLVDTDGSIADVVPGIVDYGDTVFPTIGPSADITVAGASAEFRPLAGLQRIQGKLTLDAGNSLTLDQLLQTDAGGELNVVGGSNLIVNGDFLHAGRLTIGEDSYSQMTGTFTTLDNAVTQIDGVLEVSQLDVSENSTLTGGGRVSGNIFVQGTVDPGSSPGTLQTFGTYTQAAVANLLVDIEGPVAGEDHDQLVASSANLAGSLTIETDPSLVAAIYGIRLDVVLTDTGISGQFDDIIGLEIDANHRWAVFYEPDRVSLAAALIGDANFNGSVEFTDFLTLANNIDQPGIWTTGDFDGDGRVQFSDFLILADNFGQSVTAVAVPEPHFSFALLFMFGPWFRGASMSSDDDVTRS